MERSTDVSISTAPHYFEKRQIVFAVGHSSIVLFQQLPLPVNYPYCANDNRFITSYVWSVIGRWISVN